jgi:hypothetical protein
MDFKSFRPWIVQAEPSDQHIPNNSEAIIGFMKSAGFNLAAKTDVNLIFLKRQFFCNVNLGNIWSRSFDRCSLQERRSPKHNEGMR